MPVVGIEKEEEGASKELRTSSKDRSRTDNIQPVLLSFPNRK